MEVEKAIALYLTRLRFGICSTWKSDFIRALGGG
jgi:hypothetical protein